MIKIRLFLCQQCREKDVDENMVIVKVGKQNKRYHKEDCYQKYLDDQEFKKKESKEWDNCYEAIKSICGVSTVPQSIIGLIQRLRNGDPLVGMKKEDIKHFKQGFPYPVIQQAFEEKCDLIKWKKSQWNGSYGRFLSFVLSYYIMDIIENVNEEFEYIKLQEQASSRNTSEVVDIDFDDIDSTKETGDRMDITDFLD